MPFEKLMASESEQVKLVCIYVIKCDFQATGDNAVSKWKVDHFHL